MSKYNLPSRHELYEKALRDCSYSANSPEVALITARINHLASQLSDTPTDDESILNDDAIWEQIMEWLKLQKSFAALEPRVTKAQLALYTSGVCKVITKYVPTDLLPAAIADLESYLQESKEIENR